MSGTQIIQKIDEMLREGNLETREGLRLQAEIIKEAFKYIEDERKRKQDNTDVQNSMLTRIGNVENGLRDFMELRKREQEVNESERQKWRWVIITPMAGYVVLEIVKWIFR